MSGTDSQLIKNVIEQLHRLNQQLADLDVELASENIDSDEYVEVVDDTMEQLQNLNRTLERLQAGGISVVDELSAAKNAIREAISNAFRTPEIAQLFAKKQPSALRQQLIVVEADHKAGRVSSADYSLRKYEMIKALNRLKEPLNIEEKDYLIDYENMQTTPAFQLESATANRTCNTHFLKQ